MNDQIFQQVAVGGGLLVLGLAGWFLPYRWNILRLKRFVAQLLPEHWQLLVPKILGACFAVLGLGILAATMVIGRFE